VSFLREFAHWGVDPGFALVCNGYFCKRPYGAARILYLMDDFGCGVVAILAALLSSQGLRRSKVFSEALQTTVWRVVFISSSIHDESGGLFPTMYGVMFGFSAYLLFTTIRDRDGGRSDSESGQMT